MYMYKKKKKGDYKLILFSFFIDHGFKIIIENDLYHA